MWFLAVVGRAGTKSPTRHAQNPPSIPESAPPASRRPNLIIPEYNIHPPQRRTPTFIFTIPLRMGVRYASRASRVPIVFPRAIDGPIASTIYYSSTCPYGIQSGNQKWESRDKCGIKSVSPRRIGGIKIRSPPGILRCVMYIDAGIIGKSKIKSQMSLVLME